MVSAGLVLAFFIGAVMQRRRFGATDWMLLAVSTLLLLSKGRYAPLFAIVATPMAARMLGGLSDRALARPGMTWVVGAMLLVGVVRIGAAFPSAGTTMSAWVNRHGPEVPGYPAEAADYLMAEVRPRTGRILNEFNWGGYLEWRTGPRFQMLMDGRTQCFSGDFWKKSCLGGEGEMRGFIAGMEADAAVVPRGDGRLAAELKRLGWRVGYEDVRAQILLPPAGVAVGEISGQER